MLAKKQTNKQKNILSLTCFILNCLEIVSRLLWACSGTPCMAASITAIHSRIASTVAVDGVCLTGWVGGVVKVGVCNECLIVCVHVCVSECFIHEGVCEQVT